MRQRVYVVNYNGGSVLHEALVSLRAQSVEGEVVVIDNGSSDGSVTTVRAEFAEVRLLELPRNVGFGAAINHAVRRLPADRLVFVNNDAVCEPQYLEALLEPGGDVVAGVLRQAAATGRIDSAGIVVDQGLLEFDYLHGEPVGTARVVPPPLGPTGGAALVSLRAFNAVGGFDERIFAYLEDVDLAIRLRGAGFRCALAPDARALHHHSTTLGAGSAAKNRIKGFSRGYLVRRYGLLRQPRLALRVLSGEAAICVGQLAIDRTASGIPARLRGWRAARGLPPRELPRDATRELSLRASLAGRRRVGRMSWSG